MKRKLWFGVFSFWLFSAIPVAAASARPVNFLSLSSVHPTQGDHRFVVRVTDGLGALQGICAVIGCSVARGLDESIGKAFLVTAPAQANPDAFLATLKAQSGISSAEFDRLARVVQGQLYSSIPASLMDPTRIDFFGQIVRAGFVNQNANSIVRISETHNVHNVRGSGIVAVIDTGVDPDHPVLRDYLVAGYDFTRDKDGASESADLNQSTAALVDQAQAAWVNQSTAALVDQSTAALVDNPQYAAYGHGTMVAGVIHLVAPRATIMPMKAFQSNGTGYLSDILRAIHRSVHNNAKILNMSFSYTSFSPALENAINYAEGRGVICVASAGNGGGYEPVYPAAMRYVIGVASTADNDQLSSFSNRGRSFVWLAAPGEGIVTTYPFGTYAAAWGTSFSTPFVSGTAALILALQPNASSSYIASAVARAKAISEDAGNGRLDVFQAVQYSAQTPTSQPSGQEP